MGSIWFDLIPPLSDWLIDWFPESKDKLVLVVGLQDGDTDPEQLDQDIHLVLLTSVISNLDR